MLAALLGASLSTLTGWTRPFTSVAEARDQLDVLQRAELKARVDIRAALDRLAAESGVTSHKVDEAMACVSDTLADLIGRGEGDLAYEGDEADQY